MLSLCFAKVQNNGVFFQDAGVDAFSHSACNLILSKSLIMMVGGVKLRPRQQMPPTEILQSTSQFLHSDYFDVGSPSILCRVSKFLLSPVGAKILTAPPCSSLSRLSSAIFE